MLWFWWSYLHCNRRLALHLNLLLGEHFQINRFLIKHWGSLSKTHRKKTAKSESESENTGRCLFHVQCVNSSSGHQLGEFVVLGKTSPHVQAPDVSLKHFPQKLKLPPLSSITLGSTCRAISSPPAPCSQTPGPSHQQPTGWGYLHPENAAWVAQI